MEIIINGQTYTMYSGYLQDKDKQRFYLKIIVDSVDDLIEVLGDSVNFEIPGELVVNNLTTDSITRSVIDGTTVCDISLKRYPYETVLNSQSEDIEAMSQAIIELAEIIGGDE